MLMQGLRGLNLTDAQKEAVKAIIEKHKPELKAIADVAIPARQKLHAAVTADAVNEEAIRAAAAEVAATEANGAVLRAKIHSEVWAVLTPEQQQQAKQMREGAKKRAGMQVDRLRQRAGRMLNQALHSLL
jgi:protein CpxP